MSKIGKNNCMKIESGNPGRLQYLAEESEKGWQAAITDLARATGWSYYHTYDSRRSNPGYPDLTIFSHLGFLMIEVKKRTGKCTRAQLETGARLIQAGVDWRVWRPHDFPEVDDTLNRLVRVPMRPPISANLTAQDVKCLVCGQLVTTVTGLSPTENGTVYYGYCNGFCGTCRHKGER